MEEIEVKITTGNAEIRRKNIRAMSAKSSLRGSKRETDSM
jgi:hypothetical protein